MLGSKGQGHKKQCQHGFLHSCECRLLLVIVIVVVVVVVVIIIITCVDVDECTLGGQVCTQNAHCENTYGSYRCVCKEGFEQEHDSQTCRGIYRSCLLLCSLADTQNSTRTVNEYQLSG